MRVLVIRMEGPCADGSGYPVSVRDFDPVRNCHGVELASGLLPADLSIPDSPHPNAAEWIANAMSDRDSRLDEFAEITDHLSGLLAQGRLSGEWLTTCRDCGRGEGEHVRVYFDIVPEALRALPWELVQQGQMNSFIAPAGGHTFLRGRPGPAPGEPHGHAALPVKVLVITGSNDPALRPEEEIRGVYRAAARYTGLWRINVLRQPLWERVVQEVQKFQPDIFHLIGHTPDDQEAMDVWAEYPDGTDAAWNMDSEKIEILSMAVPSSAPRLYLLNTCNSQALLPTSWIADAADRAVIAMQTGIDSDVAARFGEHFYRGIVDTGSVLEAFRLARWELLLGDPDGNQDWNIPTLHITGDPERIVRQDVSSLKQAHESIVFEECLSPPPAKMFDRVHEHQRLWNAAADASLHLAVVSGEEQAGKTALVRSALLPWALDGRLVAYVGLPKEGGSLEIAFVMAYVCAQIRKALERAEVDPAILESLAASTANFLATAPANVDSAELRALLDVLNRAATNRPFILVLDNLEKAQDGSGVFIEEFVKPVAQGRYPNLHVVLVVSGAFPVKFPPDTLARPLHEDWEGRWTMKAVHIPVPLFAPEMFVPHFWDAASRSDLEYDEDNAGLPELLEPKLTDWPPALLLQALGNYGAKLTPGGAP